MSLLFSDGFERFSVLDLWRKWGICQYGTSTVNGVTTPTWSICEGDDPAITSYASPLARKGGRSLYRTGFFSLGTSFPKSRTVYLGFAIRLKSQLTLDIYFTSLFAPVKFKYYALNGAGIGGASTPEYINGIYAGRSFTPSNDTYSQYDSLTSALRQEALELPAGGGHVYYPGICRCRLVFYSSNVSISWIFPDGIPTKVGNINYNKNLFSPPDFNYFQLGFTLLGNTGDSTSTAWVENRYGNRATNRWRETCQTALPTKNCNYYCNAVLFRSPDSTPFWLDDVYIANDEGSVNNDFLGPIYVRSMDVFSQGTINDAEPQNTVDVDRGACVNGSMVTTVAHGKLSETSDSKVTDLTSSLLFKKEGDRQTFVFNQSNYAGTTPHILGVIAHAVVQRKYLDLDKPVLSFFAVPQLGSIYYAKDLDRPICRNFQFGSTWGYYSGTSAYPGPSDHTITECRNFVLENNDENFLTPSLLQNYQFGFSLQKFEGTFEYCPAPLRLNVTHNDIVSDSMLFDDYVSRHFEESIASNFIISSYVPPVDFGLNAEDTFFVYEDFPGISSSIPLSAYDQIEFISSMLDLYAQDEESLIFSDDVVFAYTALVDDSIAIDDEPYNFWVELFSDSFFVDCLCSCDCIETLDDSLSVVSSDVWDNHLDAESSIDIISSDVWDNHFSVDEYPFFDDSITNGFALFIDDVVFASLDDFDGNWVEQKYDDVCLSDSVLTQHWRHEWFMGVIINSWQMSPVEQEGWDGYRVGDYDENIFG